MAPSAARELVWHQQHLLQAEAGKRILPAETVLDLGAGIRPQQFIKPRVSLIVEPHDEYLVHLKHDLAGTSSVIIGTSALTCMAWLPDRCVDTVFMLDVLEHMSRENGEACLAEALRIARSQIVVFTPLGFMPQSYGPGELDAWGMNGRAWQTHRSGWDPEDFPGWEILGCRDFHRNAAGQVYGAFYAIKTSPSTRTRASTAI